MFMPLAPLATVVLFVGAVMVNFLPQLGTGGGDEEGLGDGDDGTGDVELSMIGEGVGVVCTVAGWRM